CAREGYDYDEAMDYW
nr:immunoglobulin heavy chain junction region [Mus musculus]NSM03821.1 immunoglobulin heavy chain junction region [Mus musculus]NSM03921.1 immunoglobulin heavy chain junction region [Mus musculus]NSM04148.1 immunoglobulin heavy chain junction region [Mus musculus]NSM04312.1 immunoglobulin heavy chain junction region [Mus musculus]